MAIVAYRVCWEHKVGYEGQVWLGEERTGVGEWITIGPARAGHADAVLDCKLNAAQAGDLPVLQHKVVKKEEEE